MRPRLGPYAARLPTLTLVAASLALASPLPSRSLAAQDEPPATAVGQASSAAEPEARAPVSGVGAEPRERPPPKPPPDVFDALSLPFRIVALPLTALGKGLQGLASLAGRGEGPNPVLGAIADLEEWGASPRLLTVGPRSGPAAGVSVHRWDPFFVRSAVSIRGSQRHRAGVRWGRTTAGSGARPVRRSNAVGEDRVADGAWLAAEFRRYAEPHFWGVGPDTEPSAAADFRWDRTSVGGGASWRIGPLSAGAGLGYERNAVARGADADVPDLQDVASDSALFGLGRATGFARATAGVGLDATRRHGFQSTGFGADLAAAAFLGLGATDADFVRWAAELVGYLSPNPRQQLALRARLEMNRGLAGRGVPFTHLASLGGGSTLRGFDGGRFRDRDAALLQSEWRYEVWRSIHNDLRQEAFLFYDVGGVAGRLDEIDASELRTAYGFGVRTVDPDDLIVLGYVALGGEGTHLGLKLSWPF